MKIYFGCAMLGGYPYISLAVLVQFPQSIRSLSCELVSDHQTRPGVVEAETKLDPAYIHDRDYSWLLESDAGIFEISNPSLGVGSEISDMIHVGKPVLLLYREGLEAKVSAYIRGKCGSKYVDSLVVCRPYRDMPAAGEHISEFLRTYLKPV